MATRRRTWELGIGAILLCAPIPAAALQTASLGVTSHGFLAAPERPPVASSLLLQATDPSGVALRSPETFGTRRRFLRAASETIAVNLIMNAFGRYFMTEGSEEFRVTFDSIQENLKAGFNWDDNTFSANNFRHPLQGGCYFSSGRANKYDFYQSSMFAFAGSWTWEYMGEKHNPSFNDWVNTALGGMVLGEVTYRLSSLVLDNTATGSSRAWRELGGTLLNPVRGFNRLLTGEAFEVHANPEDRFPSEWGGEFRFGVRSLGTENLWQSADAKLFLGLDGTYGNPFEPIESPFDHFDFGMQLNFDNKPHGIGRLEAQGALFGREVSHGNASQHVIAAYQHFDYLDNEAYTFGGQSFGVSFLSRLDSGKETVTRAALHLNAIVLGATKSDYFNISGREYDYGPGTAVKVEAVFAHRGHDVVTLAHDSYYIHSVNGGALNSWDTFTHAKLTVPVRSFLAVGLDYVLYHSERDYEGQPRVSTSNPELRAYLSWALN